MQKKINIGLIGYGVVGKRRILSLPINFNLVACADPYIKINKIKLDKKNIYVFNNWRKLIDLKSLDAIIVCTTHNLHSIIIKECIKKNLHVFVEKPASINDLQSKQILKLLKKKKNLKIRVGFNHRYHPAFLLAKKIINRNKIGKIMYIRAIYGHGGRKNYHKEWRFNKKFSGGGELIDKGSHLIDLSRLFLKNLKVDYSKLNTFFWKSKLEDNCFINLSNKQGAMAVLHASSTEWKNKFIFEIFGKYGKIEINGLGKSYGKEILKYYKMSKNMGIPYSKTYVFKENDMYSWKEEMKEFSSDIKQNRNPVPGIKDAHENLRIISTIYKSRK